MGLREVEGIRGRLSTSERIGLRLRTSARISKVCYSEISHTAIRRQSKSKDHADLLFIIIEGDEEIEADLG